MAKDNRDVVVNALLGALAIVISAALITGLSWQSRGYEDAAAQRAYQYARNAEQQISADCRRSVTRDRANCVEEAKQAAREYQRKEYDLAAQWVTAWWTKVTGAAAVFGVVLSAFGVFLVWRTFRASMAANKISEEVAVNDTRPLMIFVSIEGESRGQGLWYGKFHWKNIGSGPAKILDVEIGREGVRHRTDPDFKTMFRTFKSKQRDYPGEIVLPGEQHVSTEIAVTENHFWGDLSPEPVPTDIYLVARFTYSNAVDATQRKFVTAVAVQMIPTVVTVVDDGYTTNKITGGLILGLKPGVEIYGAQPQPIRNADAVEMT